MHINNPNICIWGVVHQPLHLHIKHTHLILSCLLKREPNSTPLCCSSTSIFTSNWLITFLIRLKLTPKHSDQENNLIPYFCSTVICEPLSVNHIVNWLSTSCTFSIHFLFGNHDIQSSGTDSRSMEWVVCLSFCLSVCLSVSQSVASKDVEVDKFFITIRVVNKGHIPCCFE